MNKIVIFVIVLAVILGGGYILLRSEKTVNVPAIINEGNPGEDDVVTQQALESAEISISNYAYSPKSIKIKARGTVTWTNSDSVAHTATGDAGGFDTGLLEKGQSKSVTFSEAGTFAYHCTPHPYMKATVIVE